MPVIKDILFLILALSNVLLAILALMDTMEMIQLLIVNNAIPNVKFALDPYQVNVLIVQRGIFYIIKLVIKIVHLNFMEIQILDIVKHAHCLAKTVLWKVQNV